MYSDAAVNLNLAPEIGIKTRWTLHRFSYM